MPPESTSDSWIVFEFTDRWLEDLKNQNVGPVERYLAMFPGREAEIRREYAELSRTYGERTIAGSEATVGATPTRRVGPYRLVKELGAGGQARVWLAEDTKLGRKVALKVLGATLVGASPIRRERFRREAELVARLEHPNLCAVLAADLDGELPWIAMRYVEGETLSAQLARERDAWDVACAAGGEHPVHGARLAERLWFFERVARALHAAHEAGVVHRDVKPGNVMVATDGSPVLLDFGLAYDESDHDTITRTGDVFGTPAYMAPEQLDGLPTDRRTDIHALAVVLYEAVTLQRPHSGATANELARAIRMDVPREAHAVHARLPRDLSVVLATALEKEPARRYATALEFAEELRRVREYEPILARPVGPFGRFVRWIRRKPVLAGATLGSIAALSLALGTALLFIAELREQRNATERALVEKQNAMLLYEGAWYRDLSASRVTVGPPEALRLAIAAAERDPGLASNQAMLSALDALRERTTLVGHTSSLTSGDVDRVRGRVATASQDGTVRVWEATSGACELVLPHGDARVWCVRFDPRGERVVTCSSDGRARIWNLSSSSAVPIVLLGHKSDVVWCEFSSDGRRVVTASRDRTARVWDAATGRLERVLEGHGGNVDEARFVDGDRRVLTASGDPPVAVIESESDSTVRVFDVATGRCEAILDEHTASVRSLTIHPDGRRFVSTSEDGTARLWDLARVPPEGSPPTFHSTHAWTWRGYQAAASFHPDGRRLAVAGEEGARVVDLETFATMYELPSHDHRAVIDIAYDPRGQYLATTGFDNTVRVFAGDSPAQVAICIGAPVRPRGVRWAPDGSWLVSWHTTNDAVVWYGRQRPFLSILDAHAGPLATARFSPDGRDVAAACADGRVAVFDVATNTLLRRLDPRPDDTERVALSSAEYDARGERLLVATVDGRASLMRVADGSVEGEFECAVGGPEPLFTPCGRSVVLVDRVGHLEVRPVDGGQSCRLTGTRGAVRSTCVSADGRLLVGGTSDRTVHAWNLADVRPGISLKPAWTFGPIEIDNHRLTAVYDVAVTPDGSRVAAVAQNMGTYVLDGGSGELFGSIRTATAGCVEITPDGKRLFTTGKWTGFARIYEVQDRRPSNRVDAVIVQQTIDNERAWLTNGSYSRLTTFHDGRYVLGGSLDRTAKLWDTEAKTCVAVYAGHTDAVWDVDESPDGSLVVTASGDGTARIWPVDVLATARRHLPKSASALRLLPEPPRRQD